jgi:hypothetical protein
MFSAGCVACRLPWPGGFLAGGDRLSGRVAAGIGRLQLDSLG